ncbi:sensor domain-containing protein [Mycobacterium heckeshornense]|uniref:sensor domain-containing protein n=1 Tax=Mycobacterium heckeshornense TaxID=110505 RepID=UPI0009E4A1EB|nr:sensor domain-containing protein [Mycobacterium heckeshornense]MCV7033340.1 sensor domain-containing protein [Mycobacterium heckeshornense]PIJ34423.1 sensor domain-containing protein [Mycobacterium heckeshornense]
MLRWTRTAVAVGVAAVLVGCSKGSIIESRGDTTTPAPVGQPVDAKEIDSLVVPMDQVPGTGDSLRHSTVDSHPLSSPSPAGSCLLAKLPAGHVAVFGNDTIAFRNMNYVGFSNVYVAQAIGIYADVSNANTVFEQLINGLQACKSDGGEVSVDSIAPNRAMWHAHAFSPVKGTDETSFATDARTVKNVVFTVTAGHFDNSQQIAASTADQIAAKINKPL